MKKYESNAARDFAVSPRDLGGRLIAFLRSMHPTKTIDSVAADTGIARSTVAKWIEGASLPGFIAGLRLIAAYGPEYLVAVYPNAPRWLDHAYREYQQAALTSQIEALQRQLEKLP